MFGFLNVHKPAGVTSRDVVNHCQRLLKPTKVGHAGTLDPLADGVLVVTIGPATRLTQYIQQMPKRYLATFLLGKTSDTEDIQGNVVDLSDAPRPTRDQIEAVLPTFVGQIMQRPPAYSAIKIKGKRAYRLARAGHTVRLEPRPIRIDALKVECFDDLALTLTIECGSGTYVRSLGRDIAHRLGTGAVMSALTRTAIGHLSVNDAVPLRSITRDTLREHLLPPLEGLPTLPRIEVNDVEQRRLAHGQTIMRRQCAAPEAAAVSTDGRLLALLHPRSPGIYGPKCNFVSA